jgi:HAD superfamily hydrolase (TIGR01509 family)
MRGIIFDLDGTLVDSRLDLEAIRRDMGLASGSPILETMGKIAPGPELDRMQEVLHQHELKAAHGAILFEGVLDLLRWIDEIPIPKAILTRNSRICTDLVTNRLNLQFSQVLTREDAAPKPDPAGLLAICKYWNLPPAEVVFCGDYLFDLEAGRRAGMRTILFAPGNLPEFADQADLVLRAYHTAIEQIQSAFLNGFVP